MAAAVIALTALGMVLVVVGLDRSPRPSLPSAAAGGPASVAPAVVDEAPATERSRRPVTKGGASEFGRVLPASPPTRLTIPGIGVDSGDIVHLGLQDDGSIEVPKDAASPGWFAPGPAPGQLGPAVIAGHVDSKTGPGVFYRLGEVRRGDRVKVTREDGTVATFVVDRVATVEKDSFPTRLVYGPTTRAELRLITCSGEYDDEAGYLSNTIVFAHLV